MHERISVDPKICHGTACVKGTRIQVSLILSMLAGGTSYEELLENYPSLSIEDIYACLRYAAAIAEEEMMPAEMEPAEA